MWNISLMYGDISSLSLLCRMVMGWLKPLYKLILCSLQLSAVILMFMTCQSGHCIPFSEEFLLSGDFPLVSWLLFYMGSKDWKLLILHNFFQYCMGLRERQSWWHQSSIFFSYFSTLSAVSFSSLDLQIIIGEKGELIYR